MFSSLIFFCWYSHLVSDMGFDFSPGILIVRSSISGTLSLSLYFLSYWFASDLLCCVFYRISFEVCFLLSRLVLMLNYCFSILCFVKMDFGLWGLQRCLGRERCTMEISAESFRGDPCPNVMKRVAVEVTCEQKRL